MSQKSDELVTEILSLLTRKNARFEVKTLEQVLKLLGKKPAPLKPASDTASAEPKA